MKWLPAGLPAWASDLARALDQNFAPLRPARPVRVPAIAAADLTAATAARDPYGLAIDQTNAKLVIAVPDGAGAYEWVNADGSAL